MTKFCWIISLINALKAKFGSIYRIKKQRESQKTTTLEGKSFLFWTGKDLSEKANQILWKMKTSLRNEGWQQRKTVSQVAHLIHVVSLAGSEDWLALNSMPWTVRKPVDTCSASLGTYPAEEGCWGDRSPLPASQCTTWQMHKERRQPKGLFNSINPKVFLNEGYKREVGKQPAVHGTGQAEDLPFQLICRYTSW